MSLKIMLAIIALLAVGGVATTVVVRQKAHVAVPVIVQKETADVAVAMTPPQPEPVKVPDQAVPSAPTKKDQPTAIDVGVKVQTKISVNGIALTDTQISALAKLSGRTPTPGDYWYDTRSGLYGLSGQASAGVMQSGLAFGTLTKNASNGTTNVLIKGRELNQTEWTLLSQLVGTTVQRGSYWLDANGNAGLEGSAAPLVNLYTAGQVSANRGGGDNFWTSRFSAGNSNADNSQGYVSVPGVGPVGYGF